MTKYTPRMARFAAEYAVDLNGNQAALRAGYAPKGRNTASRLLANPDVQAAIAGRSQRLFARVELSAERVLDEIARVAFADLQGLYRGDGTLKDITEIDDDTLAGMAVDTVETPRGRFVRLRRLDKLAALALLGRHFKLFTDSVEIGMTEDLAQAIGRSRARALERAP